MVMKKLLMDDKSRLLISGQWLDSKSQLFGGFKQKEHIAFPSMMYQ
jgi:hypothetical protein